MTISVHHGDMLQVLPTLAADSFHACVTDPPYHLTSIVKRFGSANAAPVKAGATGAFVRASKGFMGKTWDGGDVAFQPETWAEVLRVMKPGAHLVAFGGTRTFHRMAVAIEDAGFELRDTLMWVYGSGFPKSHDVSKGIDKAAGAEREVLGRTSRRVGPQGSRHVDGLCGSSTFRENPDNPGNLLTAPAAAEAVEWTGWGTALKPAWEPIILARKPLSGTVAANTLQHGCGGLNIDECRIFPVSEVIIERASVGRWPSNLIHDGSDEVLAAFPQHETTSAGGRASFVGHHAFRNQEKPTRSGVKPGLGDTGSVARFFYTAKADATDRAGSKHPTVKPVSLMRYLVRLITPPNGLVLDCFAGSGTTGMACLAEGFNATLIEREAEYVADINRRIAHVSGHDCPLFDTDAAYDRNLRDLFTEPAP